MNQDLNKILLRMPCAPVCIVVSYPCGDKIVYIVWIIVRHVGFRHLGS